MKSISEKEEIGIQALLPRSTAVVVDHSVSYSTYYFFRYVEGSGHITGICDYEKIERPWHYYVPTTLWDTFGPGRFIVVLPYPVCWDNEDAPIPSEQLEGILDRIERALRKKHKRYKIVYEGREAPVRMR